MKRILSLIAAAFLFSTPAYAGDTPSPAGAEVYFVNLKDGDTVTSPVTIIFGLKGIGVAPAGVAHAATGHHHLYINRPPFRAKDAENAIPHDAYHMHFGGGQTQATLHLLPGENSLQLVLGDANHMPFNPPVVSKRIVINVK